MMSQTLDLLPLFANPDVTHVELCTLAGNVFAVISRDEWERHNRAPIICEGFDPGILPASQLVGAA